MFRCGWYRKKPKIDLAKYYRQALLDIRVHINDEFRNSCIPWDEHKLNKEVYELIINLIDKIAKRAIDRTRPAKKEK